MIKNLFRLLAVACCIISTSVSFGQGYKVDPGQINADFQWPAGKKMAISLTFDDARFSQVDNCLPLLDQFGVKATFYILPKNLTQRIEGWKKAVVQGHEIGNHSLYHACSINFEWTRKHSLEETTLRQMKEQLDSANDFIQETLGVKALSFAYPCGQKYVGKGENTKSYVPLIARKFETGRSWHDEGANDPIYCNFVQLNAIEMDGKSFEDLKLLLDNAKTKGKWLILAGHEVNNGGDQTTLLTTLEAICKYAADPANEVWLDNVHNIYSYIKNHKKIH